MKKIILITTAVLLIITTACGCSKTKPENDIVDNCLIEKFPAEEITTIVFVQGKGTMRDAVRCNRDENAEDIDSVVEIFGKVSSDGEPSENYDKSGLWSLNYPSIEIDFSSGNEMIIEWEMDDGILIYDGEEYYISNKLARELYSIFTKYNDYNNNRI